MTPMQQTLVELAHGVNPRAVLSSEADMDRPFRDIGIDSLEVMSVMLAAMEKFDIEIPDAEADVLASLNELGSFVEKELVRLGRSA